MEERPRKARPRRRELSRRVSAGLEVVLYWSARRSAVTLSVHDSGTGEAFEVEVPAASALDAFRHPYAYSGRPRVAALTDV
ncbi:MAG TPA: hypothetical protein VLD16_06480 [Gaiellaceae bacterium]|nr:hypothetical protein [Gaiellaceae bacterium]